MLFHSFGIDRSQFFRNIAKKNVIFLNNITLIQVWVLKKLNFKVNTYKK